MIEAEFKHDELTPALEALSKRLGNKRELMDELGELAVKQTKDRFPTGQAPDGTPWAPKSQATLDAYGAGKSNRVDRRPLFGPSGRLSSEIFHEAGEDSVEWGSALIYAGVMQDGAAQGAFGSMSNGSPIPWGDIPARPFVGLSDENARALTEAIYEWLERGVQQAR